MLGEEFGESGFFLVAGAGTEGSTMLFSCTALCLHRKGMVGVRDNAVGSNMSQLSASSCKDNIDNPLVCRKVTAMTGETITW